MAYKQSPATRRYEEKVGMISKSYKLKKEVVEQFAKACEKANVSQSKQLTDMMLVFINSQNIIPLTKTIVNQTAKDQLIEQFESTLSDFWGEEPTRRSILEAWKDFLNAVRENESVPDEYYKLTKNEKEYLYRKAGL